MALLLIVRVADHETLGDEDRIKVLGIFSDGSELELNESCCLSFSDDQHAMVGCFRQKSMRQTGLYQTLTIKPQPTDPGLKQCYLEDHRFRLLQRPLSPRQHQQFRPLGYLP